MARFTRRGFLKATLAGTVAAGAGGSLPLAGAAKKAASDWVTLGNSGVKVTRLALGTGTFSGRVQRELGQDGFNRLVRHAYDRGIRFFETAEAYRGMPEMLGIALKGLPRDSYRVMTKYAMGRNQNAQEKIDGFRRALQTEQIDILLMHCLRSGKWPEETKPVQDAFAEAKSKKVILAHGLSVHGLQPLAALPGNKWMDVALLRVNHKGVRMDTADLRESDALGDVPQVASQVKKIHAQGTGVLGMKLIGEGAFTNPADRDAAMKFAFENGVDAVTIGFKSTAEIDEAIERMNRVLNV